LSSEMERKMIICWSERWRKLWLTIIMTMNKTQLVELGILFRNVLFFLFVFLYCYYLKIACVHCKCVVWSKWGAGPPHVSLFDSKYKFVILDEKAEMTHLRCILCHMDAELINSNIILNGRPELRWNNKLFLCVWFTRPERGWLQPIKEIGCNHDVLQAPSVTVCCPGPRKSL
jgi:hypothetical protein